MPRFFIPPEQIHGQAFTLTGSEARHAALVLRKKIGDVIDLFDGKDLSYQGRIDAITPQRIEGVILSQQAGDRAPKVKVILFQALIKGPKWDWLVEKACEIGVHTLVPVITARTVVKPTNAAAVERWKRIALAAAKQCGRSEMMDVSGPKKFDDVLKEDASDTLSLIPWEKESAKTIRQTCENFKGKNIRLWIGPEGGWENEEVSRAESHGAIPVSLGPTLLRSETAGLIAAALVLNECRLHS